MPYPVAVVEIAFTDGPYVVSPTWTDVTAYVRSMDISRGIPDDWTLQADGSATVTLSNRDRRFDPFNTTGPYFGNLLPRRQIRIRATHGGTTYDVFRGFIAGWPPEWTDAGQDSTVTLQCFDALQLLGSSSLPQAWSDVYIKTLSPTHYWPLDDPIPWYQTSNFLLRDLGSVPSALYAQVATAYQSSPIASGIPSSSLGSEINQDGAAIANTNVAVNSGTTFSVSMWTVGTTSQNTASLFNYEAFGVRGFVYLDQTTSSTNYGRFVSEIQLGGIGYIAVTQQRYEPTEPHNVTVTWNPTGNVTKIYVDGFDMALTTSTGLGPFTPTFEKFTLGYGSFQQVCMFPSVLTATQARDIVRFSEASYQETTTARLTRVIQQTPYSTSLVSGPTAPASDVLAITPGAVTAVSELTKVSDSEYAPLFVNKAGTLTLYNQNQIRSQTKSIVSQATYGAGGLSIGTDVQLQYDGDSMRNVANIQMSGDGVYIQENSSSVTTYGEAEQYVTTQVQTLQDADAIADIVNGWGGQVYAKASPVSVVLSPSGSWGSTLGLELFERFTLAVAPPTGNTITTPMLVSRISHSVTPERWNTTLEGSARWAAVFILNQSTLGGTDLLG